MKTYEGRLVAGDEKFCIIISRFNDFIGSKLLSGAVDELRRHGVNPENIDIVKVPGAFEGTLRSGAVLRQQVCHRRIGEGMGQGLAGQGLGEVGQEAGAEPGPLGTASGAVRIPHCPDSLGQRACGESV